MASFDIVAMKARLQKYLSSEGLNNRRFEQRCGLYNGFVKDMDTKITFESLAKISFACPNLNLGWLFSGLGEMKIAGVENPSVVLPASNELHEHEANINVVKNAGAVIISDPVAVKEIIATAVTQALESIK